MYFWQKPESEEGVCSRSALGKPGAETQEEVESLLTGLHMAATHAMLQLFIIFSLISLLFNLLFLFFFSFASVFFPVQFTHTFCSSVNQFFGFVNWCFSLMPLSSAQLFLWILGLVEQQTARPSLNFKHWLVTCTSGIPLCFGCRSWLIFLNYRCLSLIMVLD